MTESLKLYVAGQLRSFRRNARLTQEELSAKINRTGETISNIERGRTLPSLETIIAIADVLDLPIGTFFPSHAIDESISQNRLLMEAEVAAMIRGLSDRELDIAVAQLKALSGNAI